MPMQSINPLDGKVLESFPTASDAEVQAALDAAAAAQQRWRQRSLAERAQPMRKVAELLRARAEDYARIMALEMGKPIKDGVAEVNKCALACEHYAEHSASYLEAREVASDASRSYVRFDPLGVVLAIMPWNFPFWQVFRFIAPNLMAGNAGILKHASNVPQCALAIDAVMRDAGFPEGLFRSLLLESARVTGLIADPRIAAVTLTGSEPAGRKVAEAAGRALKPVVLELGGSDPFIVLEDADVERAAEVAAQSRCINAGQSCIAAKRFIVTAPVYERFMARFLPSMEKLRMGDPLATGTDIGPQARHDLRDALHEQVQQAVKQGAKLALGGQIPEGEGAFYPPSVLTEVAPSNLAYQEEIFGPVATVIRAADAAQAIAVANDTRFGLGASLWTESVATAERWVPEIEAGAVFVNGLVKSDPRLPFGGVKASGLGRELGLEGARAFVNTKTVWMR